MQTRSFEFMIHKFIWGIFHPLEGTFHPLEGPTYNYKLLRKFSFQYKKPELNFCESSVELFKHKDPISFLLNWFIADLIIY